MVEPVQKTNVYLYNFRSSLVQTDVQIFTLVVFPEFESLVHCVFDNKSLIIPMYAYIIFACGLARHFGQYHRLDRDTQSGSYAGGLLSVISEF